MKKSTKGLIIGLLSIGVILVAGLGVTGLRHYQVKKAFVGTWVSGNSDTLQEFIKIDYQNRVTIGMKSSIADFSEDIYGNTYTGAKIKGTKLSVPSKNINHYLMSHTIFEGSSLNDHDVTEISREFVDSMFSKILTGEEIDEVVTLAGRTLTVETKNPKLLKKILQIGDFTGSDQLTYRLSNKQQVLKMEVGSSEVGLPYKKLSVKEAKKFHASPNLTKHEVVETSDSSNLSEDLEIVSREEVAEEQPWIFDLNKFAYYFLVKDDKNDRQTFIDEFVADEVKATFRKHLNDQPYYPNATQEDLYADERVFDNDLATQLVSVSNEIEFLLKKDKNGKIIDVIGPGWTKMTKTDIDNLATNIKVRPTMTLKYFVVYYLIEADGTRRETIEDNPEYATDEAQKLLLSHAQDEFKDFSGGSWYLSNVPDQSLAMIINDSDQEPIYIITLNDKDQLTHVYGENFETLSQTDRDYVMTHKGKLNTVF